MGHEAARAIGSHTPGTDCANALANVSPGGQVRERERQRETETETETETEREMLLLEGCRLHAPWKKQNTTL